MDRYCYDIKYFFLFIIERLIDTKKKKMGNKLYSHLLIICSMTNCIFVFQIKCLSHQNQLRRRRQSRLLLQLHPDIVDTPTPGRSYWTPPQ